MIEVDRYLEFLDKHNLVPQQFLLLLCIYHKKNLAITKYKSMFPIDENTMIGKILFDELIQKGFIVIAEGTDGTMASHLSITEKFTSLYVDDYEAASQLRDAYPSFLKSEGKVYPLTLWDEDELRRVYWEKIKGLYEEHKEVLIDLAYGVKHNLIKGKMETFVRSRYWSTLRKMRKGEVKVPKKGIEPAKL